MKRLVPIPGLCCPTCGKGMKVAKPTDAERHSFQYECRNLLCGQILPVARIDDFEGVPSKPDFALGGGVSGVF